MSFGFSVGDIIAVCQQLARIIYTSCFNLERKIDDVERKIDDFKRGVDDLKRKIDSLGTILQKSEQLDYSRSQGSLYETRLLTQTVSACGTTLGQLKQLLREPKIDDGTTSRRITCSKRKLYVSQTNIERLKMDFALCVSQIGVLCLAQSGLRVPDDASTFLRTLLEEPNDVPISDAAGSMNKQIIYKSDKYLDAMRTTRKRWMEGHDNDPSLLCLPRDPGRGKSTPVRALVDKGVCTNIVNAKMRCSYGLGDQELCDNSISTTSTKNCSQDSYYLHGLDKGAVIASGSLSDIRSSFNDLYDSCTICDDINYISSVSKHKDFSYGSWANLGFATMRASNIWSATTFSTTIWSDDIWSGDTPMIYPATIWSDNIRSGDTTMIYPTIIGPDEVWSRDTPRQWSFLRSSLKRLGHAMSRFSLRTSEVLTLVSPIFFSSPASADASYCGSQNDSVRLKTGPHHYSSWFQALDNVQRNLLYLWTHPDSRPSTSKDNHDPNAESQPSTILLACFLCTSCVAVVAQAGRNDPYQTHIVGFCATISSIAGALRTDDVQAFVFVYLFWGCLGGLVISLFLHRVGAVNALVQRGGLSGKASGDDDDGLRRGLGDEKS